nr:MAG TPA: hypothetical protein [Caudoviricetes sp.]
MCLLYTAECGMSTKMFYSHKIHIDKCFIATYNSFRTTN